MGSLRRRGGSGAVLDAQLGEDGTDVVADGLGLSFRIGERSLTTGARVEVPSRS